MTQWDIEAKRSQIKRLYGHQQLQMAIPALRSVIDRRDYAHYHYHEANDLFGLLLGSDWPKSRSYGSYINPMKASLNSTGS